MRLSRARQPLGYRAALAIDAETNNQPVRLRAFDCRIKHGAERCDCEPIISATVYVILSSRLPAFRLSHPPRDPHLMSLSFIILPLLLVSQLVR